MDVHVPPLTSPTPPFSPADYNLWVKESLVVPEKLGYRFEDVRIWASNRGSGDQHWVVSCRSEKRARELRV